MCVSPVPDAPDAVRTLAPRRHRRDTRKTSDAAPHHVHELHLTYISSGPVPRAFQRSFMFAFESLLDAQIIFDEIIKVVLVK